jgi:hypothetical protein
MWSTGKNNKIRTIQMVKHFNISISEKTERKWRGEFHQKQENLSALKKNHEFLH